MACLELYCYILMVLTLLTKNHSTVYAMNQFGDLSVEEFSERILMPSRVSPILTPSYSYSTLDMPPSYDWREHRYIYCYFIVTYHLYITYNM